MFWNIPEAYMRTILVLSHNKCMTWWNVLESSITRESRWRFRLYSALPWPDEGNEFNGTIEALKNEEKTLENCMSISIFYRHLGDFLFSQLPVFFMKVTMNGKSAWLRGWGNRKTMRNKCPEQTLQVKIQYCIQLRSSITTMVLNVLHTAFSLFL